ncbi:MAG: aminopeptidase, partial [Bacteroidales bacterium]|nr:aminopeptidase [Bacteroidales bacterium]
MKKLVLTAALAAMCAGFNAYAQQPAGAPDGGISAEMLAKISDRYEGTASDKALRNALATTSISTLALNAENAA